MVEAKAGMIDNMMIVDNDSDDDDDNDDDGGNGDKVINFIKTRVPRVARV